uniref:Serine/threonine-protein phosphatase T n=1 Tax=Ditylum brightwellii TaxID=49249 RepID=A0A6V2BPT8_9STRA|mmetsp:Transcript_4903/g.7337  ORF Transcript_4903/g.7337 Transcript_4903/m.7337 type:complete len:567 (+) Transcript_4903:154-1854(+)
MSSEVKPPAVTPVSDDDDSSHGGSTVDGAAAMEVDAEKSTENGESSTASPAAAAAAAAAAKAVPDDAEAEALRLKDLGNTALSEGHPLVAIQFYSTSLEYSPNNAIVLSNRAMAYIKVENYGLAILDATAAIKADPSYPKGFYRRGTAQFALGKAKAARKDFRSVCKLRPKDKDARAKLKACEKSVTEAAFAAAIMSEAGAPLSETFDVSALVVDAGYDGPHPGGGSEALSDASAEEELFGPGKLPRDFVMAAIEQFRNQKLIHKRYVARLLISAKHYFESLSSLMEISIPTEGPNSSDPSIKPRITVCGDTHGQYYDVLNIFEMNGYPSKNNPYLFNGDFVDRGSFSVETILTYLLFKMSDPECIYLTRGNHETKNMTNIYGFEGEVKAKYDDKIFSLFLEMFGYLPLAATIGDSVFVTHGGLPTEPGVTLDDVRKIKRGCEPPESGLMSDLLWSDPQPFPGKSPSKRGVGYSFGPDIAEAFLKHNNLSLLVRSHEVKDEGYVVEHGGKTITVFSAPNYCDSMGNKGAFIHFEEDLKPKFTQYDCVPHPNIRPMAYAAGMGGLFS